MMWIMIPVYVINALYLWPITLWVYSKYGRPNKLGAEGGGTGHHHETSDGSKKHEPDGGVNNKDREGSDGTLQAYQHPHTQSEKDDAEDQEPGSTNRDHGHQHMHGFNDENNCPTSQSESHDEEAGIPQANPPAQHMHDHSTTSRPFFATVTVGVCHCGAGCVLGDIVGEWLVYGTNATIGSNPPRLLWAEMLVDFGFAFLFGIVFQYFSIAPMAADYSWKSVWRALKADALSLVAFEVGLFGWMCAFQIGVFQGKLEMPTVTYWWMMQVGMFIGHWTGVPANWWLIKGGVKEPCV